MTNFKHFILLISLINEDFNKMFQMNIKKALEKLVEWQAAHGQLKPHLPSGDLVLNTWFQSLQDFKKDLPLLHKLANDALKVCDIFVAW